MKKIIAATDFSDASFNAISYAAHLAVATGSDLYLLHVHLLNQDAFPLLLTSDKEGSRRLLIHELNKCRDKLMNEIHAKTCINIILREGDFIDELQQVCTELHPYLVVIGSGSNTVAERLLFGSNALVAMKELMWPLIVVPLQAAFTEIKNIGFSFDFENVRNTTPFNKIKALKEDFGAQLHVIHLSEQEEYNTEIVQTAKALSAIVSNPAPIYHFVAGNNDSEKLISCAVENNIDLLIIVPKQHDLIYRLLHKSISKSILLHSIVPLLILHSENNAEN